MIHEMRIIELFVFLNHFLCQHHHDDNDNDNNDRLFIDCDKKGKG